jgi:hypothetical protein
MQLSLSNSMDLDNYDVVEDEMVQGLERGIKVSVNIS